MPIERPWLLGGLSLAVLLPAFLVQAACSASGNGSHGGILLTDMARSASDQSASGSDAAGVPCAGGCAAGSACCQGSCLPFSSNPDACGVCGTESCAAAPDGGIRACIAGSCVPSLCGSGFVAINNSCVPLPLVIFSDSFGGAAKTALYASAIMYGRILNLTATSAQSCIEGVGSSDGSCANLATWTTLPNADWSFDPASSEWRASFAANTFPAGMYRNFARNGLNGATMPPWVLTLKSCYWSAVVVGGTPQPPLACGPGNVNGTTMASGYTWTCVCP